VLFVHHLIYNLFIIFTVIISLTREMYLNILCIMCTKANQKASFISDKFYWPISGWFTNISLQFW